MTVRSEKKIKILEEKLEKMMDDIENNETVLQMKSPEEQARQKKLHEDIERIKQEILERGEQIVRMEQDSRANPVKTFQHAAKAPVRK